jgi:hypothetical protein
METESLILCSEEPSINPYPEPYKPNPYYHILFL